MTGMLSTERLGSADARVADPVSSPTAKVDPNEIQLHLERLLNDPDFQTTERRRKILSYIVGQALGGRSDRLKGFDIAVAVLGRDEHFDPQTDPIVRIEVGKLRGDLQRYYLGKGAALPLRIEIPKGGNAPVFVPQPRISVARGMRARLSRLFSRRATVVAAVLLLVAASARGASWWVSQTPVQSADPAVVVEPFVSLSGGEDGRFLAIGLTNDLVADLVPFDGLQVFSGAIGPDLPAALKDVPLYLVKGTVERMPDSFRAAATLVEFPSGRVIWSQSYQRPLTPEGLLSAQDQLSAAISEHLAQIYSLINLDVGRRFRGELPATLFAYDCVQRAFAYRQTFDAELYAPMRACLETAVARDPGYADAWAMLAFAHLDAARYHIVPPEKAPEELDAALVAARRSVELAPERVRPLQALSAAEFMRGDYAEAEAMQRRAIARNPNDPESLAQLGWRMMARSRPQEAIDLLSRAIDLSLHSPAWYSMTMSIAYFDLGERQLAYDAAVRGKDFCCGLGKAMLAVAAADLGKWDEAQQAFTDATSESTLLAQDPRAFWATWQLTDSLIIRLDESLALAQQMAGHSVAHN